MGKRKSGKSTVLLVLLFQFYILVQYTLALNFTTESIFFQHSGPTQSRVGDSLLSDPSFASPVPLGTELLTCLALSGSRRSLPPDLLSPASVVHSSQAPSFASPVPLGTEIMTCLALSGSRRSLPPDLLSPELVVFPPTAISPLRVRVAESQRQPRC